jgi:transposase InsO family protein
VRRVLFTGIIGEIHAASRATYGIRRVRAALLYERGLVVNKKLVRKLMRAAGLEGLPARKKGRRNLVGVATQEDLVNRNFTATSPNRIWLTDVTEHNTREGTLYCCAVLDLFSRRVVGWAIDRRNDAVLVNDALLIAARRRSCTATTVRASSRGLSPRTCGVTSYSARWAPSETVSIMRRWSPSGARCRLSSSTGRSG